MCREMRISMRVLWVTREGYIRSVNMDSTTPVPQWAGKTILSVSLLGPIEHRQFIAFTQFQFGAILLDAEGRRTFSDADRQLAMVTEVMFDSSAAAVLPYPLPNDVQREAIYTYITKRWAAAMAHPQSKLAWHNALRPTPGPQAGRLRWSSQPFQEPE